MSFKPSAKLSQQIAQHIGNQIISGQLKGGERLIEGSLARELGVSYHPLREAMLLLEKDGLVEIVPRRGVWVTPLTRVFVDNLYDILTELYTLLFRWIVQRITDDYALRAEKAIKKIEDSAREHNVEGYHNALSELGGLALACVDLPLLNRMITEILPAKRRIDYHVAVMRRNDLGQSAMLLRRAFRHVLTGDGESAVKVIRAYVQGEKSFVRANICFTSLPTEESAPSVKSRRTCCG